MDNNDFNKGEWNKKVKEVKLLTETYDKNSTNYIERREINEKNPFIYLYLIGGGVLLVIFIIIIILSIG